MKLQVLRVQYLNRGARKGGIEEYDALAGIALLQTQVRTLSAMTMANNQRKIFGQPPLPLLHKQETTLVNDSENWMIDLYYAAFAMQHGDHSQYDKLRALLHAHNTQIAADEKHDFFTSMLNFCARQANSGNERFRNELLKVYKEMLEMRYLHDENGLPYPHFKNIISTACMEGEVNWAETFSITYIQDIVQKHQDLAMTYNSGVIQYFKKNYSESEKQFNRVLDNKEDLFYTLDARNYLLRIYYHTDDEIRMDSHENSFRKFLERSKTIQPNRKKPYLNHLKYYRKLRMINPHDPKGVQKLIDEIQLEKVAGNTAWMLEELKKMLRA